MKTLRNQKDIELAETLNQVIQERRVLEKTERKIKDHFKRMNEPAIKVGNVLITFTERQRTSLDKNALIEKFGEDVVAQFEKVTAYLQADIKAI